VTREFVLRARLAGRLISFAFFAGAGIIRSSTPPNPKPDEFMEPTSQRPSTLSVVLLWLFVAVVTVSWVVFWWWWNHNRLPAEGMARAFGTLAFGGLFLGLGAVGYWLAIITGAFSPSYKHPVWPAVKVQLIFASIVELVLLAVGAGLILAAFLEWLLVKLGLKAGLAAHLLPVMAMIVAVPILCLWVLVWAPLERRIIWKRLKAMGVTRVQLQSAVLVGLSNPASGLDKRFGRVEVLIYHGDGEQFGIGREQLAQLERRMGQRGMAHILLHINLSDGSVREIRLHMEGHWTMGARRRAMDTLADAIARWHAKTPYLITAETRRNPRF
jgi:hypothetical protein